MTELTQRSTRLHEQALVTASKQMPSLVAKPVEAAGERRLQPLHAGDEISEGCFQREMEMIAMITNACRSHALRSHAWNSAA